jgi:two-component system nitrate/nitrite response regulator NarP
MKRSETQKVRPLIAIADKSSIVRMSLVEIIVHDGRFNPIFAVATAGEFLKAIDDHPVDIGIIGWSHPDMTGGDILIELRRRRSKIRIIIYTGESSDMVLCDAVPLGAWGFASKRTEPLDLLEIIASVASGRSSFPRVDLQGFARTPRHALTDRERELLSALANGWGNQRIAEHFGISRNTVKFHLKNLYDKLDVDNRTMAVALLQSEQGRKR